MRAGVAMRSEPVVEKAPSARAVAPLGAERLRAATPVAEKLFFPKARELAEIASVPALDPGAARAVAELGFEKRISEAFKAMLAPAVV